MQRLQRFLAIPMAATAAGCLWLLWRQGGWSPLLAGAAATVLLAVALGLAGRRQRSGQPALGPAVVLTLVAAALSWLGLGRSEMAVASRVPDGTPKWSEERVAAALRDGRPAFVYFTADWCLTCKVNEAGAINREAVSEAFKSNKVELLAGDWTNGDPVITRFLESRGRAGVPLYLWYEPGGGEPEELPQVLTPGMLTERAARPR